MAYCLRFLWIVIIVQLFLKYVISFKFTVVHSNDMHARFDPVRDNGEECHEDEDEMGLCYGGFARLSTAIENIRAERKTIYLIAGDTLQGTPWSTIIKGQLAAELMNMLQPDAMALGKHDFDNNVAGLAPFLKYVKFPVVCSNLNVSNEPGLRDIKSLVQSTIITKYERKIGIIGYVNPETKQLVATSSVSLVEEIPQINAEAKKLTDQGVNIIIALGHSGFAMDQKIALSCKDVDLVVGGYSHAFLYTGTPPENEHPEGNYPTVVVRDNGQQVPVVQAYAFTKYLGRIDVEFDNGGHMINFGGEPIQLNSLVEHNSTFKAFLDSRRAEFELLTNKVVGISKVILDGSSCSEAECSFGNLITDAIVYARLLENHGGIYWTDASIAVYNGGGVRGSIDPDANGTVKSGDIMRALPFRDKLSVSRIMGRFLVKALEHSASLRTQTSSEGSGGFLQVSGIRLIINYNRPKGKRITYIYALCASCPIPKYEPLERDKYYNVIVPNYILNGGAGHIHFKDYRKPDISELKLNDSEMLIQYLQDHRIVYPSIENRIRILERRHLKSNAFRAKVLLILYLMCSLNTLIIIN